MYEIPEELKEERDRLVKMIYEAFDGVSRVGGVSWSQADVCDGMYTPERYEEAGKQDTEESWKELVNSNIFVGCPSNWSFLDQIGFRYYLAPKMVQSLLQDDDGGCFGLYLLLANSRDESKKFLLKQWSSLDARQSECVARYVHFQAVLSRTQFRHNGPSEWEQSLNAYWKIHLPEGDWSLPEVDDGRVYFQPEE